MQKIYKFSGNCFTISGKKFHRNKEIKLLRVIQFDVEKDKHLIFFISEYGAKMSKLHPEEGWEIVFYRKSISSYC